jgi:hypothetical protein
MELLRNYAKLSLCGISAQSHRTFAQHRIIQSLLCLERSNPNQTCRCVWRCQVARPPSTYTQTYTTKEIEWKANIAIQNTRETRYLFHRSWGSHLNTMFPLRWWWATHKDCAHVGSLSIIVSTRWSFPFWGKIVALTDFLTAHHKNESSLGDT